MESTRDRADPTLSAGADLAVLAAVTTPLLVLAAVLGSALGGNARQLTAAVLVAVLVSANGLIFLVVDILPGTVPVGVAAAVVVLLERRSRRTRRRARDHLRPPALQHPMRRPEAEPMDA